MRPATQSPDGIAARLGPRGDVPGVRPLSAAARLGWALRKYVNILRISLIERMTYRGDFLLGTLLRFLPMVTTILLWQAVYGGNETQEIGSGQRGYTFHQMIAYLLLVHISRMFSSMPGLAHGIAYEIRDGTLKKYLLQPLDMIGYLLSYRAAHKCAYITMSALPSRIGPTRRVMSGP